VIEFRAGETRGLLARATRPDVIFLKEPVNARRVTGLIIGMVGAALITFLGV
jgi:drug/metabolite transporter (DMT)-like permease